MADTDQASDQPQAQEREDQSGLLHELKVGEMRMERAYRLDLHVGTRMMLRFGWGEEKHAIKVPGELVGYAHYEFIIVRVMPVPGLLPRVSQGGMVSVRFLNNDGAANIFQTEMLSYLSRPTLLLTLAYPQMTNTVQVRKHKRIASTLPVLVTKDKQEASGIISDISRGGCRLIMDMRGQDFVRQISVGDKLNILVPLKLRENLDSIYTTVKNIETDQFRLIMGLAFEPLPNNVFQQLSTFLSNTQILLS